MEKIMRKISTEGWSVNSNGWNIAPAGLDWIKEGSLFNCSQNVLIGHQVKIGDGVRIGAGCQFVNYTRIEDGTSIGNNVTADCDLHIGKHAYIGSYSSFGKFVFIGNYSKIGERTNFADSINLGPNSKIGNDACDALDLGAVERARLTVAQVKGVAYVGLGEVWLPLKHALEQWENRIGYGLVMCLMQSAVVVANKRGWTHI
jgi:hypothetical protein